MTVSRPEECFERGVESIDSRAVTQRVLPLVGFGTRP